MNQRKLASFALAALIPIILFGVVLVAKQAESSSEPVPVKETSPEVLGLAEKFAELRPDEAEPVVEPAPIVVAYNNRPVVKPPATPPTPTADVIVTPGTHINKSDSATVQLPGGEATIFLPAGATNEDYYITINAIDGNGGPGQFQRPALVFLGQKYEFKAYTTSGQPITQFNKPMSIRLKYDSGKVTEERQLGIFYWNEQMHTTMGLNGLVLENSIASGVAYQLYTFGVAEAYPYYIGPVCDFSHVPNSSEQERLNIINQGRIHHSALWIFDKFLSRPEQLRLSTEPRTSGNRLYSNWPGYASDIGSLKLTLAGENQSPAEIDQYFKCNNSHDVFAPISGRLEAMEHGLMLTNSDGIKIWIVHTVPAEGITLPMEVKAGQLIGKTALVGIVDGDFYHIHLVIFKNEELLSYSTAGKIPTYRYEVGLTQPGEAEYEILPNLWEFAPLSKVGNGQLQLLSPEDNLYTTNITAPINFEWAPFDYDNNPATNEVKTYKFQLREGDKLLGEAIETTNTSVPKLLPIPEAWPASYQWDVSVLYTRDGQDVWSDVSTRRINLSIKPPQLVSPTNGSKDFIPATPTAEQTIMFNWTSFAAEAQSKIVVTDAATNVVLASVVVPSTGLERSHKLPKSLFTQATNLNWHVEDTAPILVFDTVTVRSNPFTLLLEHPVPMPTLPARADNGAVPLYRFYSNQFDTHFYTADPTEKDSIVNNYPREMYRLEGIGGYVLPLSATKTCSGGTIAVVRFYSPNTYQHMYTLDPIEIAQMENNPAWVKDGPAFCAWKTSTVDTLPMYRYLNKLNGAHFFTLYPEEISIVDTTMAAKYQKEGAGFYALKDACAADNKCPTYRFWVKKTDAHFYTINPYEFNYIIQTYQPNEWAYDGIVFAVGNKNGLGICLAGKPVFRFYSAITTSHFFTISVEERDNLMNDPAQVWTYDGVAYCAYDAPGTGLKNVFRLYYDGKGDITKANHLYTIDVTEKNNALLGGYVLDSNAAFYVW